MAEGRTRPAWAEVDTDALAHNAALLARLAAPADLWAVVKADGYGHGAVTAATAALKGGARGLAVALVEEGVELREAGIDAPVLVLSQPPADAAEALAAAGLIATLDTPTGVNRLARAASRAGVVVPVHVKVDTGMHRVGAAPGAVPSLAEAVAAEPTLALTGVWTHLAVADEEDAQSRAFTATQLDVFDRARAVLSGAGGVAAPPSAGGAAALVAHAANTAAAIACPRARYDLVRCGIGLYGAAPSPYVAEVLSAAGEALRPVLSLKARVTALRRLPAGARPSYGRLRPLPKESVVATVPLGYADGVARRLFATGAEVLIGGRRRPLAGQVTMDQIVVDCGDDPNVAVGDEVVLLGRQDDEHIDAEEWARRLGTIAYEVLCDIGPRVPRRLAAQQ